MRKKSGFVAPPRESKKSNNLTLPNVNETNWLVFFIAIGLSSSSLTKMDKFWDFKKLILYFALLNPKTGNALKYPSKWSCKSNRYFFAFVTTVWRHQNLHRDSPLPCRLYGCEVDSRICAIFLRNVVSTCKNSFFFCALISVARFSRESMKDDTKSWDLTLRKNVGSSTRRNDVETEVEVSFLISVVVSGTLDFSSSTQTDSTSELAILLKCSSMYGISEESSLSKCVSRISYKFFQKKIQRVVCQLLNVSLCPSLDIEQITRWATIDFEETNDIRDITNVTLVT